MTRVELMTALALLGFVEADRGGGTYLDDKHSDGMCYWIDYTHILVDLIVVMFSDGTSAARVAAKSGGCYPHNETFEKVLRLLKEEPES
ncbi:MAG: hypothetical protein HRU18_02720 [Pseudoalteromonas sp.]|uniref:hypothetical protein n=1 Tax=Pseudoalteromonas sp. TaxID=53249 RepID=UPI001E02F9BE|nr:hypothetical protein [Pseudoalteromonas sp.]NRA77097.1 hypothetical protein [Pseudoalteromonas sp.]